MAKPAVLRSEGFNARARVPLRVLLPREGTLEVPRRLPLLRLAAFLLSGSFLGFLFYQGWTSPVVTLERTACLERCPTYELTIYGDGSAIYHWEEPSLLGSSRTNGVRKIRLDREAVDQLISEFQEASYFAFADSYERQDAADHSFVTSSFTYNGQTKKIRHYLGDLSAPEKLTRLEEKVDDAVNSALAKARTTVP